MIKMWLMVTKVERANGSYYYALFNKNGLPKPLDGEIEIFTLFAQGHNEEEVKQSLVQRAQNRAKNLDMPIENLEALQRRGGKWSDTDI